MTRAQRAGAIISRARLERSKIGHLQRDLQPEGEHEAYAIQREVQLELEKHKGPAVGKKIGCTTSVMQELLGMAHPCFGSIYESGIHYTPAALPFESFSRVGVECEIAVKLGSRVSADSTNSLISLSSCVESVMPAIEVVDDRYVSFQNHIPNWETWIGDDFFHSAIVLGEALPLSEAGDLANICGEMKINNKLVGSGHGRDIINGHPLEALAWLARKNYELRNEDLPAGSVIMLGSVVQTKWLQKGDLVEVSFEGLGGASAKFV
jgi:2-keto-4-pentenoate hydratase